MLLFLVYHCTFPMLLLFRVRPYPSSRRGRGMSRPLLATWPLEVTWAPKLRVCYNAGSHDMNATDANATIHICTCSYNAFSYAAVLGFFVPYLDLDVIRLPTPPWTSLACASTLKHTQHTRSNAPRTKWYFTPGQSCARPPRTITTECCCTLCPIHCDQRPSLPPNSKLHHTFTRYIRRYHLARTQPHPRNLALPRIRLLGLRRADLQTYAFELRPVLELWAAQFARALGAAALPEDLD